MKFALRQALFLVAMIGLLAASYYFVFHKATLKRQALQARIDARQKDLDDLQLATAGVRDIEKKIAELQKATSFFESKLPQEKEIDKVLGEVWPLTERHRLQTRTIRTPKFQRMNGYSEQTIEMTLSGNFDGFYSFLLDLEKLPRLTRVTHMNLTKIQARDGEMQAQVTMSIFFEPESDGPAPGGAVASVSGR